MRDQNVKFKTLKITSRNPLKAHKKAYKKGLKKTRQETFGNTFGGLRSLFRAESSLLKVLVVAKVGYLKVRIVTELGF